MSRKIACIIGIGLLLAVVLLHEAAVAWQWSQVRWVDDGDTVVLSDGTRVRYIGVNAPEIAHEDMPAERFGPEAKAFNRQLVYQKKVRLELDRERHDQYGRLLAYVYLPDGRMLNCTLVREGYGYADPRFPHVYQAEFSRLQDQALRARRGLWKDVTERDLPSYYRGKIRLPRD